MRLFSKVVILFLLLNVIGFTAAAVLAQRPEGRFSHHFGCAPSMELYTPQAGWLLHERWTLKQEQQKLSGAGEKTLICKYIYSSSSLREDEVPDDLTASP